MRQPTKAQEWARKRNWAKFLLRGLIGATRSFLYRSKVLTDDEKWDIEQCISNLRTVERLWDNCNYKSKEKYLHERR